MTVVLGENRYGKSRVRVMKVTRGPVQHHVDEWNVDVWLEGDFRDCFERGDNSELLPTDTMKNTVYSLARSSTAASIEDFARELVTHFIAANPYIKAAGVHISETSWKPIVVDGRQFPTAFTHDQGRKNTVTVTNSRIDGLKVVASFEGLWLLKTAKSAFSGFLKDRLTTLKETQNRLFGTLAKAEWHYTSAQLDFVALRQRVESAMIATFAAHDSLSVQQTLYAMAEAALNAVDEITELSLSMPNKHCNLVDLSAFGQDNPNQIFVPTDEPHGSITARVRRSA